MCEREGGMEGERKREREKRERVGVSKKETERQ